ncbi:MAG: SUMF1/EgtB/PvdO family nonheme iron enzyme [Burkholderiales bacterium]|nr:SUMF1/EgtB/PvdO family nonheme iron enzyme [Opitutaceae bacterium]
MENNPAKTLLEKVGTALASGALPEAAQTEIEFRASLDRAEQEMAGQKARLLALGRPVELVSEPAGLRYTVVDAYGRTAEGVTPATVEAPWGRTQVTIASPGSEWADFQRELQVERDAKDADAFKAVFAKAAVRLASTPSGLAYELIRANGSTLRGITPAELADVPTGPATLRVSRPAWPVSEQRVEIDAGRENAFAVEFATGGLTLRSEPAGAAVLAGEDVLGYTPMTVTDLVPGEYSYLVKLKGFGANRVTAQVVAKETARAEVVLTRDVPLEPGKPYLVPELGLELLPISAGTFTMGSPSSDPEHNSDETQHAVTLRDAFWLGKFEVTRAEWRAVMEGAPADPKTDRLPVTQVSWEEVMEFCRKLTARERAAERLPAGLEYTLPTEAQWEYACRAGTTGPYGAAGSLDELGWYRVNSGGKPHEVGRKKPNAWGLHDMHGNVWEWCADWFAYYPEGKVTDPAGPPVGVGRVNRGGGWGSEASSCRAACRLNYAPSDRTTNLGFRLALSRTAR